MPTPAVAIADLFGGAPFDQATPITFQDLLERLWQAKYQGSITLDFAGGLPRSIVLSQPIRVDLDTPSRQKPLDKV